MKNARQVIKFEKHSRLSNYYECPNGIYFDNRIYGSSEAAYQSCKTVATTLRNQFSGIKADPSKKLGRQVEKSEYFRPDWKNIRVECMRQVLRAKFEQNPDCMNELVNINTINADFIEDTTGWHDTFWGKCYCPRCNGKGTNMLGKLLTELKDVIVSNQIL